MSSDQNVNEIEKLKNTLSTQTKLIDLINCGVLAYTLPDRRILIMNGETKRMFGGTDVTNFGTTLIKAICEEDLESMRDAVRHLKNPNDVVSYQVRTKTVEGKIIDVKCTTRLLLINGQRTILSVLQDLTEEMRTTRFLTKKRLQYMNALIANCESHFSFDVTEGIIHSDFEVKGYGLLGETYNFEFPCTYNDFVKTISKEFQIESHCDNPNVKTSEGIVQEFYEGHTHIEFEIFVKKWDHYSQVSFLLSDDSNGHISAIIIAHNVTNNRKKELKRTKDLELANATLHEQLHIIQSFSNVYFATWMINLNENTMSEIVVPHWLHCVTEMAQGNLKESLVLIQEKFITDPDSKIKVKDFFDIDTIQERFEKTNMLSCEYKGNVTGWCSGNLIIVDRNKKGQPTNLIYAIRNIDKTKQRELEAEAALKTACATADRANAAKTDFLSRMSHDIRTPMNAIIGLTAIANKHLNEPARLSNYLEKINVASQHLLSLINEVLDMSRIESGKVELSEEELNLPKLIDELLELIKPEIENKKHKLRVSVENIIHENVIGDGVRIKQIFTNIVGNAIKYTPAGGKISIRIRERATTKKSTGCYEFTIEDNGIGIPPDYLEKIFTPFERVQNEQTASIQGTGLGLAITKNIVAMMNGNIKVQSALGKGTCFTITIFLKVCDITQYTEEELKGLRVLVADDDEISCIATCDILSELDMESTWVLSSKEAVDLVIKNHKEKNDFFAIILDWKMPEIDGVEAARRIRKITGKKIPIIILSAYDTTVIEKVAQKVGINSFISKPLFKSKLLYTFHSLLGETKDTKEKALDQMENTSFKGKRILLAEDNELNREIATEILSMADIQVDTAENGKIATEKFASSSQGYYDLIFMDVQMPIMNGYDATVAIRAMNRDDALTIPIIAMTANAFADDVLLCKDAGMDGHIAKPIDTKLLKQELEKWLGK